jgi:hypothetical protein
MVRKLRLTLILMNDRNAPSGRSFFLFDKGGGFELYNRITARTRVEMQLADGGRSSRQIPGSRFGSGKCAATNFGPGQTFRTCSDRDQSMQRVMQKKLSTHVRKKVRKVSKTVMLALERRDSSA